jgi:proteasome lid subunit RPN8/RPN11
MFPIYLADRRRMNPKDDICYIVAKNGLFLKKKLGIIESLTPVNEVPDLQHSVHPYARMSLPKIPKQIFCSVFSLFRKVYEEYRSECVVLLFYNEKTKKFRIGVPYQKVSYTGNDCVKMGSPEGFITAGSIHSHCNFSAFHSGADIADEEYIEGLHITIGEVDEDQFSMVASIVSNRKRFKVDPLDFINGIDENTEPSSKLKYLIVGGYIECHDPKWLDFITGTKYEPPASAGYLWGHFPVSNISDIKNYQQYLEETRKGYVKAEKVNDPCKVCPFRKEKDPEISVADLFFEGY